MIFGLWFLFVGISGILYETKVIRAGRVEKASWLIAFLMEWQRKPLMKRDRSVDSATFWALSLSVMAVYVFFIVFALFFIFLGGSITMPWANGEG